MSRYFHCTRPDIAAKILKEGFSHRNASGIGGFEDRFQDDGQWFTYYHLFLDTLNDSEVERLTEVLHDDDNYSEKERGKYMREYWTKLHGDNWTLIWVGPDEIYPTYGEAILEVTPDSSDHIFVDPLEPYDVIIRTKPRFAASQFKLLGRFSEKDCKTNGFSHDDTHGIPWSEVKKLVHDSPSQTTKGAKMPDQPKLAQKIEKIADKVGVPEEKLEHYLLGGPGSKDPSFVKDLSKVTPVNWGDPDNVGSWLAKMGMTSEELTEVMRNLGMASINSGDRMTKEKLKAQLRAQGIQVRGNFVKKSDIRAYVAKAANTHELVKKIADKAKVPEEKLEHYLLGGPGSKDPSFTKELEKTGIPQDWDEIDDLDAWMAKMGLNSKEILKMLRAAQASTVTADGKMFHIEPPHFHPMLQHFQEAEKQLDEAWNLIEEYHQQVEALDPKFRDHAKKAFGEIKKDIHELAEHLGKDQN